MNIGVFVVSGVLRLANWYTLVVSTAWRASQILKKLQGVQVTVGSSLRARQ
jgi:hypothetical protein